MKPLSAFLFGKVVDELQQLVGTRLEKVQQTAPDAFKLVFSGNKQVLLQLGVRLNMTRFVVPGNASQAAMLLRRRLEGLRLEALEQKAGRIAVFDFGERRLVGEFFSRGNLVLTDADWKILWCFKAEEWKDRKIGRAEKYAFPTNVVPEAREDYSPLTKEFAQNHACVNEAVDEFFAGLPKENVKLDKLKRRLTAQEKALQEFAQEVEQASQHAALIKTNFELIEGEKKKHKAKFALDL